RLNVDGRDNGNIQMQPDADSRLRYFSNTTDGICLRRIGTLGRRHDSDARCSEAALTGCDERVGSRLQTYGLKIAVFIRRSLRHHFAVLQKIELHSSRYQLAVIVEDAKITGQVSVDSQGQLVAVV